MRRLRALWRVTRLIGHGLWGLWQVSLIFPWASPAHRHRRIQAWSQGVFRCLGMGWSLEGGFRSGAKLLVANHVSWLDIMAVHAACPEARFVSKAEVRHWPLVGRLVRSAGTLFIERERRRDALRVAHDMASALAQGDTVAVFPEGTTGPGWPLLPFHANLLQAAIAQGSVVQAVALVYADTQHAPSPHAEFVGDTTLAQSLWRLACAQGLRVQVRVLNALDSHHADRRALAARLRGDLCDELAGMLGQSPLSSFGPDRYHPVPENPEKSAA